MAELEPEYSCTDTFIHRQIGHYQQRMVVPAEFVQKWRARDNPVPDRFHLPAEYPVITKG